jgi:glycosyltransferase involved in cell wall biosynthesis
MMSHALDMDRPTLISICIPTYRRPSLLLEALRSCVGQTYQNFEIVIGDDSPDNSTESLVAEFTKSHRDLLEQPIQYKRHSPSLGQNGNVNDLFLRARGERVLLLHDDDILLPKALEHLSSVWELCPSLDAVFGKQLLIENDGTPLELSKTEELNFAYRRTTANAGLQRPPIVAGIWRMFPNDGFLVTTSLARKIGYRSFAEVGHACDMDFGLRFCAAARDIWFVDEYTAKYRTTDIAISKTSIVDPYTYAMLCEIPASAEAEQDLRDARRAIAPAATSGFARMGKPTDALRLFLSRDYPFWQRFKPRGLFHLLWIARAYLRKSQ